MSFWCRRIFISESLCDLSIGAKRQQLMPSKLNTHGKRAPYSWVTMDCFNHNSIRFVSVEVECMANVVLLANICLFVFMCDSLVSIQYWSLQKQTLIKSLKYCEFEKIYGRMSNDTLDRLAVKNKKARITVEKANRKRIKPTAERMK